MDPSVRVITLVPLSEIWDDKGTTLSNKKLRELSQNDIRQLLRRGAVHFVVANVGDSPLWIPKNECYEFWKTEVKVRLVAPDQERFYLEMYPDEYCYLASEWVSPFEEPIIVITKYH